MKKIATLAALSCLILASCATRAPVPVSPAEIAAPAVEPAAQAAQAAQANKGVDLPSLPIGTRLEIGEAVLEVSQIGKECHEGCAIKRATGDCVMPRRGIFARVVVGGRISREDRCRYRL